MLFHRSFGLKVSSGPDLGSPVELGPALSLLLPGAWGRAPFGVGPCPGAPRSAGLPWWWRAGRGGPLTHALPTLSLPWQGLPPEAPWLGRRPSCSQLAELAG